MATWEMACMTLIVALHHASVLVEDLPRARHFYEDILGLVPDPSRPQLKYDGVWYSIGAKQIHLLALDSPEKGLQRPEHGGRDRHTALLVSDIDLLMARLHTAGIAYTQSHSGRRAIFCRDPDDNALEFIAR
jgi:catechol 2,3-dioxygenase-like lactoylglutathione lyase family enzyme